MRNASLWHVVGASLFATLASATLGAQATAAAPATILAPAQLKAIADSLPAASLASIPLGRGSGYTYSFSHRDVTGAIEVHVLWTDMFVIQSGSATLLTGGSLAGATQSSAGEWRDGTLTGGTMAPVKPGDVVIIPAGTPHQFRLAPGEQVNYLTLKIAAATK
ncbi:hypothetical protein BH11GEM2_BH11GEM2_24620 [soil metagenome]